MERVGQVLVETYRVERLVAEGGMASVYEARHLRVPKRFAVKFLRHQLANHAEALARFRREAEIIATLEHPNIVQLIDYNVSDDGLPYIVLEFLDGEDLLQRMQREGRMGLLETLKIARQTAAALEAAHARDITHRDLKPANLFVTREGVVKVLDFGVAKLRRAPELTALNVVVGTVGYMSPEQISGKEVDPRTDQWALASIIYAMLAGEPAFEVDAPVVTQAMRILNHRPPDIDGISPAVNAALRRGMAKNPFERYATVGEMVEALIAAAGATVAQRLSQEFDVAPATDPSRDLPAERTAVSDALDDDVVTSQGATLPPRGAGPLPPGGAEPLPPERTTVSAAPPDDEDERPTDPTALGSADARPTLESMPAITGEIDNHAALRATLPRPVETDTALPAQKTMVVSAADAKTLLPTEAPPAVHAAASARVYVAPDAHLPPSQRATLPPTLPPDGAHIPPSERVTLKPQMAPPELEALRARARAAGNAGDTTSKKLVPRSHRVAWILFGAAAGGGVATVVYLLFSR